MLQHPMLGIALAVVGLIVNQYAYLHDLIADKHEGAIIMGTQSFLLAVVGLVILIAGLVIMQRARSAS